MNDPEPNSPAPPERFGDGITRPPGIYLEAVVEAWTLLQRELPTWLGVAFLAMAGIAVVGVPLVILSAYYEFGAFSYEALTHPAPFMKQVVGQLIQQVTCLVSFPLTSALAWLALKQVRGQAISFSLFFEFLRSLPQLLVAGFVYGLLVGLGSLLFLVPGLFATAAFSFAGLLILDRKMPAAEALVTSATMLGPFIWRMILLQLALSLFILGGLCLFFVGALFAIPIYYIVIALHYEVFLPRLEQPRG